MNSKIKMGLVGLGGFCVGLFLGIIWEDLPFVTFNTELKLYEVGFFGLTLAIGFFVPFTIRKLFEDNRFIKTCLVDEIKNIITTLSEINSVVIAGRPVGSEQKDQINFTFHKAELQISSFQNQLEISFPTRCQELINPLKGKYHEYKDVLTGGDLMMSTFTTIDIRFFKEHATEYSKIETFLKTVIHTIHKF